MVEEAKSPRTRSARFTRIEDAAAALFVRHGYRKTSIDDIVREARVSKGLFYHYFPDKASLYLRLYDSYLDAATLRLNQRIDTAEPDFFKRFLRATRLKVELMREMPLAFDFLTAAYYETDDEVAPLIKGRNDALIAETQAVLRRELDFSGFADEESFEKALEIVVWVSEGFVKKVAHGDSPVEGSEYLAFEDYLDLLRTGIRGQRKGIRGRRKGDGT